MDAHRHEGRGEDHGNPRLECWRSDEALRLRIGLGAVSHGVGRLTNHGGRWPRDSGAEVASQRGRSVPARPQAA